MILIISTKINRYVDRPINRHLLSTYCVHYTRADTKRNNICSYVVPTFSPTGKIDTAKIKTVFQEYRRGRNQF